MKKKKIKQTIEIHNRKASYDYSFIETFVAGIKLYGTEIKSIRQGKASLVDTFCYVTLNNELFMKNSYIAHYEQNGWKQHEERRDRKLLMHKKEIKHLYEKAKQTSITIVPVKMFIDERGFCKVLIALAKGKKEFDKRESIKQKDAKRELDRVMKNY